MSARFPGSRPAPPVAPLPTHREKYASLPNFVGGQPGSRLDRCRGFLKASRKLVDAWHREGTAGISLCRLNARTSDVLLQGCFEELTRELAPPAGLALLALGGYGRRELAPFSDLDLLLLRDPDASDARVRPFAVQLSTLLWDLKFALGWSVRTPAECARAADEDPTVRTALLDARFICGDAALAASLECEPGLALSGSRADAFVLHKVEEMARRRAKFGESVFLLEPNLKLGEGGLRDLEAALWVARARYRVRDPPGLLQAGVLPTSSLPPLNAARDFLLRIRHGLHLESGRKEDRLTFDLQESLASSMGYVTSEEGLAVEQFMRDVYLSAQVIRRSVDDLIARCEEVRPVRGPLLHDRRVGGFQVFRGRLTLDGTSQLFQEQPASVLKLFRVSETSGAPLYSYARDQVVLALPRLAEARGDVEVVTELKALFMRTETRGRFLWEMHELGALGSVLPEFGRITARHQHDSYHVYTVDIHSLFALSKLYALRSGDLVQEEPELSRTMQDLQDPLPLYLGMLLHDAGKGLGGDHSERGRELMRSVGERLKLTPRQCEISEFLVRHHLLMSRTAQRRDLSDPELIAEFAQCVGDLEMLSSLYLLSFADISCVGPGMWNSWKAQLLKELFDKSRAHLARVGMPLGKATPRAQLEGLWAARFGIAESERLSGVLSERYFSSTKPEHASLHKRLLDHARTHDVVGRLLVRKSLGFSELHLCARDRPGFLSLATGALAAHRIDILSARVESTADGFALDVFEVRGPNGRALEVPRWRRARSDLRQALRGELDLTSLLERRRATVGQRRAGPPVETRISIDNAASRHFTVVDVRARDRVGLLHDLTRALAAQNAKIALAKVATEANRAIDSFYITRRGSKITPGLEVEELRSSLQSAIDSLADPP